MTALPELHILDVAHGNSAIIRGDQVCVVDSPRRPELRDRLRELKVTSIDYAIVSHSDSDHVDGIANLLADEAFTVNRVIVNADAAKGSESWENFRSAVALAKQARGLKVTVGANATDDQLDLGQAVLVEIVAPEPENVMSGPGGKGLKGEAIDGNTGSIVLRVKQSDRPRALLAGDMTAKTLTWALEAGRTLSADILVFPHHGGGLGKKDNGPPTRDLLEAVNPSTVIFSNGRGKYDNPRPAIVQEVLRRPNCKIACTQLSVLCAGETADFPTDHVAEVSAGKGDRDACAGSVVFKLDDPANDATALDPHQKFLTGRVHDAICKKPLETQ